MRQLWTMTVFDLRQRVRDRSVLIFGLVVPFALMYVFNLTMGGVQDVELEPVTVAASTPAGDQLAANLVGVLEQVEGVDVTVEHVPADNATERARAGEAALAVVVPEGFSSDVMAGRGVAIDVTEGDGSGIETDILLSVLDGALGRLSSGAVAAAAAGESGVPPDRAGQLAQQVATQEPSISLTEGRAASEQLTATGALVAGQAGLFLLFTVGFGVLALLTEREQGTLARLRSMPMKPGLIVAAKGLVSYILGVVATIVLLTAGSLFFDVSFGSPLVVFVLVLCVVAAGTSLMFIVARIARTAEQANIMQSILALVLGIAGGAFFPLAATGLAGRLLDLNPIAAFTRSLGTTSGGGGFADVATPIAIMLGFAVICLGLSRLVPNRGDL